ncbi:MAG: hypothetical protein WCP69_14400 [Bacteroidota bacterium]
MRKNKILHEKNQKVIKQGLLFLASTKENKMSVKKNIFSVLSYYWRHWKAPVKALKDNNQDGWITLAGELNWN